MSTLAHALNEPLRSLFSPSSSFTALFNALARITGNAQPVPDESAATASLISAVCNRGHSSFVADYALEICADPNLSSTDIRHMPVMKGDACQEWVLQTASSIQSELSGVMSGGSILANPTLIAKLSTKLAGVRTANDAIRSGGLPFQGVAAGVLELCLHLAMYFQSTENSFVVYVHGEELRHGVVLPPHMSFTPCNKPAKRHCVVCRSAVAAPAVACSSELDVQPRQQLHASTRPSKTEKFN